MKTLAEIEARTGISVLEYLDRQASVPVITMDAPACQGDVSIFPVTTPPARTKIAKRGVVVSGAREGGHEHVLVGPGMFDFDSRWASIGTLTVPAGCEVILTHPEHGAFLITEGTYRIGQQREYAGYWRAVAD
jgi:hypothetical protein